MKTEISTPGDQTAATVAPEGASSQGTFVLNAAVGTMVDQYRLDQKLGEGGMGAVWKAFHVKLQKHVALKVLPAHFTRDAKLVARFEREMVAVGKVDSPHVVRAMDAGEYQGLHYLVMEYVDGADLSQFVKGRGPQPVRNACELVRQAALGLAAAHKLGLVHRDIKPSNLFLTKPKDGGGSVVKILDLGLARLQDDTAATDPGAGLTGTGTVMGTPDYMAPEQWGDTHTVDGRADLYALGCTLYFLLTGRPPFGDEAHSHMFQKMAGHVNEPIPDLRAARQASVQAASVPLASVRRQPDEPFEHIPEALDALYRKLLAKNPADRIQTAGELATQLQAILKSEKASVGRQPASVGRQPHELPPASPSTSAATLAEAAPAAVPSKSAKRPSTATPGAKTHGANAPRSPASAPRSPGNRKVALALGGLAAALLLGVIIITIKNKDGTTTKLEVDDSAEVSITRKADDADSSSVPQPSWHGWPADAPKPAIAPFDAAQAKKHQEEWAAYLKVPVEHTNSLGMKFVLIPPGEFTMGSTPEEIEAALKQIDPNDKHWQECIKSEAPRHKVILTQPIYQSVTEVTQAEYEKVMGKNPSAFSKTGSEKQWVEKVEGLDTSSHPVEGVSWNDAAEFCAKLSQQEKLKPFYFRAGETVTPLDGTGYRLPTEAEWEFACRAGTITRFSSGDTENDLIKVGWFGSNAGGRTHAAGELKANPFGLFDIHGNVFEWVQDAWEPTYYGKVQEKPALDPNVPSSAGARRVLRGGSWLATAVLCRSSVRDAGGPTLRGGSLGFRVSLVADAVRQALKIEGPKIPKPETSKEDRTANSGAQRSTTSLANSKGVWPADAPKPAIAPFDAAQAKKHQEEWASYLKIPVEHTNSIGMKFVLIPPGEFLMGSTADEIAAALKDLKDVGEDKHWQECIKSEAPQHKVILTQPIYLGVTEVTQAEYEKVMGKNPSAFAKTGPDKQRVEKVEGLDTSSHPVENVSWNDATEFCAKLSQQEKLTPFYSRSGETVTPLDGTGYRLPSEAEWEFACRAGTTTKYWIGDQDEDLVRAGWFGGNSGERTHAAGELKANPFGLSDIHGNVWEWVQDGWDASYYGQFSEKPAINPHSPFSAAIRRVLRGGDVGFAASYCRSSGRVGFVPPSRFDGVGFRVSLVAVGPRAGR